jgi:adenylate cyclase, class 2
MVETEIKLKSAGTAADACAHIESLGYKVIEPRTLESDQLFDRGSGELMQADQILRLRRPGPSETGGEATVTYKGPASRERYKSREEIEFQVSNADAFQHMLERLGYVPGFRYEKYRTKFAAAGEPGIVTLDETPMGVFLELEGAKSWIDATATRLGFALSDYSTASYAALYREFRQENEESPADMIFGQSAIYNSTTKQP